MIRFDQFGGGARFGGFPSGGNALPPPNRYLGGFGQFNGGSGGFGTFGGPGPSPPLGGGSNNDQYGILGPSRPLPMPNLGQGNFYQDRRYLGGFNQPLPRVGY